MTNSSIPAESPGSPSPVSASYLWEAPNKAISVQISLDVIDRMEREVIDSFKAVTKRGSEVGGILLGRIAHAGKITVFVENYESVSCDYERGPLYLMAEPDKERLREALQRLKSSPLSVVGFFRSNTRKDLALDEDDLALAQEYFSDPNQVLLLVKPFAMRPSTAGFFVWEDGQIKTETDLQFPFRRSELQKIHPQSIVQAGGRASETHVAEPAREDRVPVVFPKREERPVTTTPVFARREESRPGPVVVPPRREEPAARYEEPAAPPGREEAPPLRATAPPPGSVKAPAPPPLLPKREERPSAPPLSFKREERPAIVPTARPSQLRREERPPIAPVGLKREERPAAAPQQEEPPRRIERPSAQPVARREEVAPAPPPVPRVEKREEPAAVVAAPPRSEAALGLSVAAAVDDAVAVPLTEEPVKHGAGRWIAIILVILLLIAGAAGYYVYRTRPAPAPADAGLSLRVERNAGQLVLTWNRNAAIITNAQKATLQIIDGDHTEDVDLDLGTLHSGSIVYSPITNDVAFRLEVSGADGTPVGESVRALAGRPSAMMQQAPLKPETTETKPSTPATPPVASQRQEAAAATPPATQTAEPSQRERAAAAETAKPPAQVTVAPPKPESLAARLRRAEPRELAEPPSLEGQVAAPISPRALPGQTASVPPPPAPPPPAAAKPTTQQPNVRVGGIVEEAVVIRRVQPVYPPLARQARIGGNVRVEATIGPDGRVLKATAISGPPLLRQAAAEAVQRWQYRPGRLNGQPVQVTTQVDVSFTLSR
jgi:TonB family protein